MAGYAMMSATKWQTFALLSVAVSWHNSEFRLFTSKIWSDICFSDSRSLPCTLFPRDGLTDPMGCGPRWCFGRIIPLYPIRFSVVVSACNQLAFGGRWCAWYLRDHIVVRKTIYKIVCTHLMLPIRHGSDSATSLQGVVPHLIPGTRILTFVSVGQRNPKGLTTKVSDHIKNYYGPAL